jgi:hypothetical protein
MYGAVDGGAALGDLAARGARYIAVVLATMVVAAVTLVMTPGGSARADTTFASGQVFASVGFSNVGVFDGNSGSPLTTLTDSTPVLDANGFPTFTTGSVFDSSNNFYVADDSNNAISKFSSTGAPMGQFATGLDNPESPVFDNSGNLYVGQQSTPYIAKFSPTGQRLGDIGPLKTELFGDDWIDLSSDQCTFYYTSEGTDIMRYNACTNTQLSNFNVAPFTGLGAFQLKILANGDVLVADSSAVLLLDQNGNVIQTYSCGSLPGCAGLLFAVSVDPNGTSFWTGDAQSGDVWQIDIATGNVLKSFATGSPGLLFGLTVDGQLMAATAPTITRQTVTNLSPPQVSGPFSFDSPTPVSSVLTDSSGNPVSGEQVTFTLNGDSAESCTSVPTGSDGVASCDITPTVPAQSYTLTASFAGDNSSTTPLAQSGSLDTITVTPDTTTLTYTGPTTAVNGQPVTLTGTLTTDVPTPGTPLNGQPVTFTLGSQSCTGTTDANGNVQGCVIPTVDQTVSNVTVTGDYAGSSVQSSSTLPTPVLVLVTEPTTLTVHAATGDYSDATTVSGTLTHTVGGAPIAGEHLTLTLDSNETCTTGLTDATGTASCSVTPSEIAATYPLTGSFFGDTTQPLWLMPSSGASNFVVTLEETTLTYTGPTVTQNGQTLTLSGVLTSENAKENASDAAQAAPIAGRTVVFQLGTGASAQTCVGATDATGTASCQIASVSQAPGPIPVTDTFPGDAYYQAASAASTVNLPEGTQLTINPTTTSGVYNGSTPVSATLTNTYTNQPVPGEPVTFTVTGAPPCTATTNAQGVATCAVTPDEPAGTYTLSASFPGDTSSMPQLLPNSTSTPFTETQAPTSVTYTGPTTLTNGQPVTLTGVVTSSEPTPGTPIGGETVTITIGSGGSSQSCTGTSAANGVVSCTVANVNQTSKTVPVTATVMGNDFYQPSSSTPTTDNVQSPTTLTVTATTGQYGGPTTVTGTLTNTATGQPVVGQTVTLTLNGTQSCNAVTGANGQASCSITPNEPAGSYTTSGSFGHNAPTITSGPSLLPSTGSNTFVVTKAPTTIVNTSPTIVVDGMPITLSATVSTTVGSGPGGLPVTLTLGSGSTAQSCTGTASATGVVTCTITNPNQVAGTSTVTVTTPGNSYYQSSSASVMESILKPIVMGPQDMEGDQKLAPGTVLEVGYDFTMPGNHPAATVSFVDASVSYQATCVTGSGGGNFTVPIADLTYSDPVNSTAWYATGDQHNAAAYQGSITVPNLCNGGLVRLQQGGTFTAGIASTDLLNSVGVRWHYSANGSSGSWSGTLNTVPGPV